MAGTTAAILGYKILRMAGQIVEGFGIPDGCGGAMLALPTHWNFYMTEVQVSVV